MTKKNLRLLTLVGITMLIGCGGSSADQTQSTSDQDSSEVNETVSLGSEYTANWMAGAWGITHRVDGGYKLDASVETGKYDWVAGAEEIVENIPSAGYVITSFTHPAHGFLYTLRDNENVDVAAIHPDMVPSLENEKIIFDVINVYKSAGKKVLLYLNTAGPTHAADRNSPEIQDAWDDYVNTNWNGDHGAAWRNLVEGYAKRFKGLIDGFWLDNSKNMAGGQKEIPEFVAMLRDIDPSFAIGVNYETHYFEDEDGNYLKVASDGIDDNDDREYKIIKHVVTNEYMDFTNGHVTPMGQGAPPNSWGYEEYTIPHMIEKPWDSVDGNHYALMHGWFPIRFSWSGSGAELMFEAEQAYRFVRTITDGGAAMTWSTTQKKGYMSVDEMDIMIEINNRMTQAPKLDYEAYERPEGAYLVGEIE